MRQKLFTKEIDNKLFSQYKFGNDLKNQMVVAKIFNPYGSGTFYLLNSDPSDPDYIWAIVNLFEIEVGSVSRESLEMMKVPPFGLNLERDIYFQPINASELFNRLNQGETFAKGGKVNGYKIYHETLAQTLQEAEDFFHNEGYLFTSDNYFPDITVGGIGYGETARITRPIQLQGKSKEGVANIQIYRMDSGRYELNMYPSYANGGMFADGGELQIIKNESGENYLANVGSTPNEMAVKLANGGSIPNNYRGRTTEDIWNSLTENQRVHFMFDHFVELGVKENEIVGIANQEFEDLNEDVQNAFGTHKMMGQYADGGETNLSRDRMFKSQQSWEQHYQRKTRPKNPHYKKFADGGKVKDRIEEVKKDAKDSSKRNKTKTYVFDYEFNKDSGRKVSSLSERITWGQEEDLEYLKEKGWEKYFKVIATYENGEEKMADGGKLSSYDRGVVREDMEKFVSIAKTSKDGRDFIDKARKITNVSPTTSSWFFDKYDDLDMNKASDKFVKEVKDGTFDVEKIYANGGMTNRDLNLYAQKRANELGVTNKNLGYDYSIALAQALVEGLTDSNSHSEVRQFISILEKRPEWAKDPYADKSSVPEFGSPQYSEWRDNSVYSSMYYDADDNVRELGIDVSQKSEYDGYDVAMAFKYVAQMNGEQKLASNIDKVFGGKMAKGGMVVTSIKDIPNFKEKLDEGKITYRGLGMGKIYNDFYEKAGESGTRIKVDGKEYFITDTEFDTFSRGSDGKMRIKFDAPQRKGYAKGGTTTLNNKAKSLAKNILKKKS